MRSPEDRRAWRAKHRWRKCSRCWSAEPLPGTARCAWCRAKDAERKPHLAHMRHDTAEHAEMVRLSRLGVAPCAISGLMLAQLRDCGLRLEVDRINARLGYVRGNMRVVASRVNRWLQDGPVSDARVLEFREVVLREVSDEARIMASLVSWGVGDEPRPA